MALNSAHMNHQVGRHAVGQNRSMVLTIFLNLLITIAELIGGIVSGSLALISDALHNAGDTLAILLSFAAIRMGSKKADARRTFGYKRVEILAALLNSSLLIAISVFLIIKAVDRLMDPAPIEGALMMTVALIGLAANLAGVVLLKPHARGNINIKAAWLHLMGDTVSSIAVVIGGAAIIWFGVMWIDPVITLGIAIFLIRESWTIVAQTTNILLQGAPVHVPNTELVEEMLSVEGVADVHHIHLWNLDDQTIHLEAHIRLKHDILLSAADEIRLRTEAKIRNRFHIQHITLQSEFQTCHSCDHHAFNPKHHL